MTTSSLTGCFSFQPRAHRKRPERTLTPLQVPWLTRSPLSPASLWVPAPEAALRELPLPSTPGVLQTLDVESAGPLGATPSSLSFPSDAVMGGCCALTFVPRPPSAHGNPSPQCDSGRRGPFGVIGWGPHDGIRGPRELPVPIPREDTASQDQEAGLPRPQLHSILCSGLQPAEL